MCTNRIQRSSKAPGLRVRLYVAAAMSALAAMLSLPAQAQAQEPFPSRPIELVVPLGAGGGLDATARLLAELLSPIVGVPVLVTNKVGASGTIGLRYVAVAKPDGYTLGMVYPAPLTIAPHLSKLPAKGF